MESNHPAKHRSASGPQKFTREQSDKIIARVERLYSSGQLGEAEVLEKPIKAVDGEWYTPQEFLERFERGEFEKYLDL